MKKSTYAWLILSTVLFICLSISVYGHIQRDNSDMIRDELVCYQSSQIEIMRPSISEYNKLIIEHEELQKNFSFIASISPLRNLMTPDEISELIKEIPHGKIFEDDFIVSAEYGISIGYHGQPRTDHRGIDIYPENPEHMKWSIYSFSGGIVETYGENDVYGKFIIVRHSERVRTFYGHLSKIYYSGTTGKIVDNETVIGKMGDTGISDGSHCHFEVQVFTGESWESVDPFMFLDGE